MARRIRVVGIGSGDPAQLTPAASAALSSVAFVVAAAKSEDDPLLDVRRALCAAAGIPLVAVRDPERDRADPKDYPAAVRNWHDARVEAYAAVLEQNPGDVGFLVWGDPSLYDSTLRIVGRLADRLEASYDVVPGLSAPTLLAAAHRIVLHPVGKPVLVTTGRRLAAEVAAGHENLVVMLDGGLTCLDLESPRAWWIWWGANLGTETERLVSGRLDEVAGELREQRAAAKADAGWVMDTYLLRATAPQVP
ncbi:MAG: precorrin-6A synthase (deacetylating) [Nocardioidaceae bacterium]|nr:precorrin-6A synthase (deacetylating) [Nocardioidaceae bacterium]